MKSEIIFQDKYCNHKIMVVKRDRQDGTPSWYCGYVSINRCANKIKLNIPTKFIFDVMEKFTDCYGGISFTGKLADPVNFMGDVIGFDTDINKDNVILETQHLCDQLVTLEEIILNDLEKVRAYDQHTKID